MGLTLLLGLAVLPRLGAAAARPAEKTYKLPPFVVERQSGVPWRYARIPAAEILARCEDVRTLEVVHGFDRALRLLALVLPERLQPARDLPRTFILYDAALWTPAEQKAALAGLRAQQTLPDRLQPAAEDPADFYENMALSDVDVEITFALVTGSSRLVEGTYLTPGYVSSLLDSRTPPLPVWFRRGFLRLYQEMKFDDHSIRVGSSVAGVGPRTHPGEEFPPLARLLDDSAPRPGGWSETGAAGLAWFVRWGLDPEKTRRESFWQFVERSGLGPPDEKLFGECFGFDFAAGDRRLAAYRSQAHPLRWTNPAPAPDIELRDATRGEIARLRGEWERLEAEYVRTSAPELTAAYEDKARHTLLHAYDRGDRDPRLLATLGLLELEADHGSSARAYLDAAVAADVVRPRAWYEVARRRYRVERERGLRDDGQLNRDQVALVLTPLLHGLTQRPAQPKAYALAAEVVLRGAELPDPQVLPLLDEGGRLFPRDAELACQLAQVHLRNGEKDRAAELARAALAYATDDALRERLRSLCAADPAPGP